MVRGQTENQVNLDLGLTPRCRPKVSQSQVNLKLGLTPRCPRRTISRCKMRLWSRRFRPRLQRGNGLCLITRLQAEVAGIIDCM